MNDSFRTLLLKDHNLAIFSLCITLSAIVIYALFKLSQRFVRQCQTGFVVTERIKFETKKITYISMMVAGSVAVTTVISLTLPITVLPPVRIAFEGVMIKITGMIFGPIVGLTVGLVTEGLTLMFVPSYIHVGYLIVAFSFGFWSGMTSYTFKLKNKWFTLSLITTFIVISTAVMFWLMQGMKDLNPTIFGIKVQADVFPYLFLIVMGVTLCVIYLVAFGLWIRKKEKWLDVILPVILICVITEILVTVLVAAWADYKLLGIRANVKTENPYITMVVVRIIQVPLKIFFNTAVLTTVYTVLRPLIKVR
ncbi:ECF transporter S component [Mycoplasma putrefaciens]|uniref:ECF transporter S component n=1 Tax=Mycoplasma putrefaciens Mput9231 TaxID=1292033 RepID=M9WE60_9MOLU|nr:ECF transporter S component [Mycoplasma putrefaciens]AGJ91081.1 Hypothetical protein, predicted transmembrane protein [Mycoplasma putrefaciens Mput9231]